jgi:hypothetical protein
MGAGGSTIVNVEDVEDAMSAGKITVQEACKYVKCPPNKEKFNNENNNNNFLLFLLIMLLVFFIILTKYI